MPNWAEQVTAIATAVGAIGLVSAIGAVIFAGRQAREARIGRQAEMAVEFFRRWSESPMVETRRLVAQFETGEALRDAMTRFIAENSAGGSRRSTRSGGAPPTRCSSGWWQRCAPNCETAFGPSRPDTGASRPQRRPA
jgi:hypothetical protein